MIRTRQGSGGEGLKQLTVGIVSAMHRKPVLEESMKVNLVSYGFRGEGEWTNPEACA